MLSDDNGTSNTDPYAKQETPDNNWIKTGSHVMIVGAEAKSMMQGYPRNAKPDPAKPFVMWPGTLQTLDAARQITASIGIPRLRCLRDRPCL